MLISNLDFIELAGFEHKGIGGLSTRADAQTYASSGLAYAHTDALAVGSNTLTVADIETYLRNNSTISSSRSSANAEAQAWEGNSRFRSSTKSRSLSTST